MAASREFCVSVRDSKVEDADPEVYCAKVDSNSKKQLWRVVDGDRLQNVESGQFLHGEFQYVTIVKRDAVWEGNMTGLCTKPKTGCDLQRWVFGPEEYYGGKLLRHF